MLQSDALDILKTGTNVFLTGSAGTGKTYVLNQYIQYLRERSVPLAITASTGIAATHINGQTIHSWSGIGIRDTLSMHDIQKIISKKNIRNTIRKAQVLIIDEISMLSRNQLDTINEIIQHARDVMYPFGGMQVIFCGDFFQLPPIADRGTPSSDKYCFMSDAWRQADIRVCYLTKQYRQSDSELTSLLNDIRSKKTGEHTRDMLESKMETKSDLYDDHTKLYTHNADVDQINEEALQNLVDEEKVFHAE